MPRPAKPFWKASHNAYYANIAGKQQRLGTTWDEDEREFFRLKSEQLSTTSQKGRKDRHGGIRVLT